MNEATLEARIDQVLKFVFPTFHQVDIVHQKSFSFRFGHHQVEVDHGQPSKYPERAIFDVLMKIAGVNIILLELKKEGHVIETADIEQGLSYARLLHPMPPLTLVSNGSDNRFYNTYTQKQLDVTTIDLNYLQQLTNNTFKLAANDFKVAIQLLLNSDPILFSSIINSISQEKFQKMTGDERAADKPICAGFQVIRTALTEIDALFGASTPVVGVVGQAFSGKTNLLYQFFLKEKAAGNFVLYVDCSDHNYSILQQLANHFTAGVQTIITKDKVRDWILNSLNQSTTTKFYLLLDNFDPQINDTIKEEAIELIDIFQGGNRVLYTADEYTFRNIHFVKDRKYTTIIGEKSKVIELQEFDDKEYDEANRILFQSHGFLIPPGGEFTFDYRHPRILRCLLPIHKQDSSRGIYAVIYSVPDLEWLAGIAQNRIYTEGVRDLYKKITRCFIHERKENPNEPGF
jgi:hypothetical protein